MNKWWMGPRTELETRPDHPETDWIVSMPAGLNQPIAVHSDIHEQHVINIDPGNVYGNNSSKQEGEEEEEEEVEGQMLLPWTTWQLVSAGTINNRSPSGIQWTPLSHSIPPFFFHLPPPSLSLLLLFFLFDKWHRCCCNSIQADADVQITESVWIHPSWWPLAGASRESLRASHLFQLCWFSHFQNRKRGGGGVKEAIGSKPLVIFIVFMEHIVINDWLVAETAPLLLGWLCATKHETVRPPFAVIFLSSFRPAASISLLTLWGFQLKPPNSD